MNVKASVLSLEALNVSVYKIIDYDHYKTCNNLRVTLLSLSLSLSLSPYTVI